jgi:hypothetical protein
MAYTTIDNPELYFQTKLYTGNGSTQSITGVGFTQDFTWIKIRSETNHHRFLDTVRGATKELYSDLTSEEVTGANGLTSFDSDGFSLGTDHGFNKSSATYASWNWKAGGSASSNSNGSITSSVSANTTAGFSIVSYTGTGSAATIGHGLSSTPQLYIIKNRSNARNWQSYHEPLGNQAYLRLNTTGAASTGASIWNNTSPTSSVFSIGTSSFDAVNANGDNYIAYCFAEKKGYSKFGSYTGNGSATNGTFVYTGFKPAFVMNKKYGAGGADGWKMIDNKRNPHNVVNANVSAEKSDAEATNQVACDFLSNGFKWRSANGGENASTQEYIYMAFAENPFVTSTGIPTTAR